jgi:hypothetical protein
VVILGRWDGRPVALSVKPNSLTISVDEPAEADVFSYDLEGRLWTAMLDGVSYRRGLDGRMVAKWREQGDVRQRRWLAQDEALAIEERARRTVDAFRAALAAGEVELNHPLPPHGEASSENIAAFDRARSIGDAARYFEVYKPVGILPPDQYMAVVLQLTEGCSFNTCTFCDFYRDRPFRIKSPGEFRRHAHEVRDFLGRGLSLRRTIFLGDANSLVTPMKLLLPLLDIVHETYDVEALGGMYAFLDGFSGDKKRPRDYAVLRERGMERVYVGMESGSEPLLQFLKKPGRPADMVNAVRAMKKGGVAVGVIALLGAGGQQYSDAHIGGTVEALNAMPLDMDDIIYFSDLVVGDDIQYARDAAQAGLKPLSAEERVAQQRAIERQLTFSGARGTPHISRYDIREFIY